MQNYLVAMKTITSNKIPMTKTNLKKPQTAGLIYRIKIIVELLENQTQKLMARASILLLRTTVNCL